MTSVTTISIYEHAWRLHQQAIPVDTIAAEVGRHPATIYRWFRDIKRMGIREFVRRKRACKHRRPRARTPEYVIQKIVDMRIETGSRVRRYEKSSGYATVSISAWPPSTAGCTIA